MTSEPTPTPDEIAEAIDAINEAIDVGYLADSERLLVAGDVERREAALLSARKLIMRLTKPTPAPFSPLAAVEALRDAAAAELRGTNHYYRTIINDIRYLRVKDEDYRRHVAMLLKDVE
jgi:hypothetical protein